MKNQIIKIAMMIILAAGLMTATVSAQNKLGGDISAATIYNGIETSEGTRDHLSGFQYGNTFVMTGTGEYDSLHLTVSINSQEMFQGVGVTGGAWSLVVFRGVYLGTIYGEVMSGDIENITDKEGKIIGKQTRITLRATGGTGNLDTDEILKLNGSFDMKTDSLSKETTAIAKLNF